MHGDNYQGKVASKTTTPGCWWSCFPLVQSDSRILWSPVHLEVIDWCLSLTLLYLLFLFPRIFYQTFFYLRSIKLWHIAFLFAQKTVFWCWKCLSIFCYKIIIIYHLDFLVYVKLVFVKLRMRELAFFHLFLEENMNLLLIF